MKCGPTGKTIFKSETAAQNRIKEIATQPSNRRVNATKFRTYVCEYCGKIHLTTKY